MKNLFEVYDAAVRFAQRTELPRRVVVEVIARSLTLYHIPYASGLELARDIVSTNRVEAEPHPLLTEN
ncbi:MAG: hypothetical protein Q8P58_00915 [Candidatus Adlerbacteria bacterium]|nr:hypothetical protein [Candidatus Adlerbacteria bacterium]